MYIVVQIKKQNKTRLLLLLRLLYMGPEECWAGSEVLTCHGVGEDSVSELAATSGGGLGDERWQL